MSPVADHPLRYRLANELHARPAAPLDAPCRAAYLAIKEPQDAAGRDRAADRAHLVALLDRFGAAHPQPGATHWFGELGRHQLKWESHTEFVTYTMFSAGAGGQPFDREVFALFPEDWLAEAPGTRITSALICVEARPGPDEIENRLAEWFVPESLAASSVLDGAAVIASDFRIDAAGHVRMAVFAEPEMGSRRIGRIVQRLCEIETYKTMSMLGFARAQGLGPRAGAIDRELTALMSDMSGGSGRPAATLDALLAVSAELENILARTSFRFGATGAYEALVTQRIAIMREERHEGRQTLAEFMTRRFDPAMRTVKSAERRLQAMAERAMRAGELLRTQVDVERSAQNQKLLESMDRRAALQLHLQRTVEGLSVVAISYYAVNLAAYLAYPFAPGGTSKEALMAALTLPVVLVVWLMIRRIRRSVE